MRPGGEALGEGIEKQNCQGERGKLEGQEIQLPRGQKENGHGDEREGPRERDGKRSAGERALPGAWIFAIVAQIHDAIDSHGGGAGGDHCYYDPRELTQRWSTVMRGAGAQQRSSESKRQGKHGVLEFDHFQYDFYPVGALRIGSDAGCYFRRQIKPCFFAAAVKCLASG